MSRVFWDTNLFIYLLSDTLPWSAMVSELRERMVARGDQLYTSSMTLGEVLTGPLLKNNQEQADLYLSLVSADSTILDFDRAAALHYASIRRDRTIKAPDAIQLACASAAGIDLFVTNDDRLSRKIISGIHFIVSLDRTFL